MTNETNWVTAMFHDRMSAEKAVDALLKAGYAADEVSLVMSDDARAKHFGPGAKRDVVTTPNVGRDPSLAAPQKEGRIAEGVGVGGLVGGSVGAIVAGIAAMGSALLLPGLGLVVAGPLAAALVGAGAGSATGGFIGGLANAGVSEPMARHYEAGLKRGGILVAVKPRTTADVPRLRQWFDEAGADKVKA
jgi:hypothetical protein